MFLLDLDIDASVSQTSVFEATQFTPQPSKKKFTRKYVPIFVFDIEVKVDRNSAPWVFHVFSLNVPFLKLCQLFFVLTSLY